MMRKILLAPIAVSLFALAACQSEKADQVEDKAEAQADRLNEAADQATTEQQEERLEHKADVVEEKGEEAANRMDDNGEVAPSEVGDTQR